MFGNTVWPSLCCGSQSDISYHLLLKLIASAHGWIRNIGRSRWQSEPVGSRKQPYWWGLAMWLASCGGPEFVAFTSAVWGCWNMCADVQGPSLESMESTLHTPLTTPATYLRVKCISWLSAHFAFLKLLIVGHTRVNSSDFCGVCVLLFKCVRENVYTCLCARVPMLPRSVK